MKKPKFNIIDVLIIVVILAVGAAGFYVLGNKTETQVKTETAEVLITIEEKDIDPVRMAYFTENVKAGDAVTVGIKEKATGTLEAINVAPSKFIYDNPVTGEKEWKDEKSEYDVSFTIRVNITETANDFLIGTAKVKVGKELNCVGKGYSGYGTVVGIEKVGGDK